MTGRSGAGPTGLWRDTLARSWRLDRTMTLLCCLLLVTQIGAYLATGLAMRAVVHQAGHGGGGLLVAALLGGAGFALAGIGVYVQFELRSDLADRIGYLEIDPEIQRITAALDGLEHLERAEYVDRLAMVRGKGQEIAAAGWVVPEAAALTVQLGLTLALLGTVHPALLLLALFAVPAVLGHRLALRPVRAAALATAETARVERHLHEVATRAAAGKEIRVAGVAHRLTAGAAQAWQEVTAAQAAARTRSALLAAASSSLFVIGYAGGLVFVVAQVAAGRSTIGDLVLAIVLAARLRGDFQWLQHKLTGVRNGLALAAPYRWLIDHGSSVLPERPVQPAPHRLHRGIAVREVTFRYPGSSRTVLGPVDLDLPAGAMVAVVGEYGSGKTTLVKLLSKFYRPTTGGITVDGVALADIDTESWRSAMSAAFQDFARFEVTVGRSVGLGDLPALDDVERLRTAVREADLERVVDRLPDGLDTQLGRRFAGVELSEGQWQKVALGRACMRRAPLLVVLDEPTASLDAPSEQAIFARHAALARRFGAEYGTITLIVSHRFSTVRMADVILVMADGRVVEQGTHDELVAAGGRYAELHEMQRRAYAG